MGIRNRAGFTRIELLVASAAVLVLAATLLPAFQDARESARRQQCASNLMRLGVALNNYHEGHQVFPPAAFWSAEELDLPNLLSHEKPTVVTATRRNWVQLLLPYLDAPDLVSAFDLSVSVTAPSNSNARTTEVAFMKCPSDPYNRPDNPYVLELAGGGEARFARGNYALNGGSEYVPAASGTLANPGPPASRYIYSESPPEFQWWGNGIAGINRSFSLAEIRNGASTTVAVDEIRSGLASIDPRGVWSLGQIGGSITWGHGVIGDAGRPNCSREDADDILRCPELYALLGKEFIDEEERMPCCAHCNENFQAGARSKHPGGAQVMMLDGAVRFVSEEIELTLWHVMHSRETPVEFFTDSFERELNGPQWTEAAHTARRDSSNATSGDAALPEIVNSIGMRFMRIPEGEFVMGLPNKNIPGRFPTDAVAHRVRITQPYYLGAHEVMQEDFERVMGRNPSWHSPTGSGKGIITLSDTSRCPVENVSWDEAVEFCRRLSRLPEEQATGRTYRLPTEAEWERACRGGQTEPFPLDVTWHSDDPSDQLACKRVPRGVVLTTKSVGSYPANAYGLYDMCGNVYEWVNDYRAEQYYSRSPIDDPRGPSSGYLHVIRGWYWVATGTNCKTYVASDPWTGSRFIGFRVVCQLSGLQ